jgi:excisionase family DNA binding protein
LIDNEIHYILLLALLIKEVIMAKQKDPNPLAISLTKAADKLGIAPNTMRKLVLDGEIPAIHLSRRWLIPVKALEAWVDKQAKYYDGEDDEYEEYLLDEDLLDNGEPLEDLLNNEID